MVVNRSNSWVGSGAINVGDRAGGSAPQVEWDRDTCAPNFAGSGKGLKPPSSVVLPRNIPAGECAASWHCRQTEGACCKYYFFFCLLCFYSYCNYTIGRPMFDSLVSAL